METTPLLADPPIDDESYRHETRTFPNEEQKQLMFVGYALTSIECRLFEILAAFLIAQKYTQNLIPITIFSFIVLVASLQIESLYTFFSSKFRSRFKFTLFLISQQRLGAFVFSAIILNMTLDVFNFKHLILFLLLVSCIAWSKLTFTLFQSQFRSDWVEVLTCTHQNLRFQFEQFMSVASVVVQSILAIFTGLMLENLTFKRCVLVLVFIGIFGFLIEVSMIRRLYNTCYALHLPRPQFQTTSYFSQIFETTPMIGVLTSHFTGLYTPRTHFGTSRRPISQLVEYVRHRPVPVAISLASTLINISLLTIGPHLVWFLLRVDMHASLVGVYKCLQALVTLHPVISTRMSFAAMLLGSTVALIFLFFQSKITVHWPHLFAIFVLISRTGVAGINDASDKFIDKFFNDEDMVKAYKESSITVRVQLELALHILTIFWPKLNQIWIPLSISVMLSFFGMLIIWVFTSLDRETDDEAV